MEVFPSINFIVGFILLVGNTIENLGTEHHLRAAHEVINYIFKFRLQGMSINNVKVDFLVGGHLNPYIAPNEKYLTSHIIEFFVLSPQLSLRVNLKKQYRV